MHHHLGQSFDTNVGTPHRRVPGGKPLIIAWASHSLRIFSMAEEIEGKASLQFAQSLAGTRWLLPLRYVAQSWSTWRLLEREKPEVVVIQSPPVIAPLIVALWCAVRGKSRRTGRRARYIIDAHTGAFHHRDWTWSLPLLRVLARRAVVTLVTDDVSLKLLENWGARGLFLVNNLPTLSPPTGSVGSQGARRVALISTFSCVEPIAEAFGAARLLPDVTFYVTGDVKKAEPHLLEQKPENVVLTGFLRGGDYSGLLKNVQGLIVLTTEPNDLSCAAYEALAMARPVVSSDGPEMRRFFTRGFIYVPNTPEAIAAGVTRLLHEQEALTDEVIAMRAELAEKRRPHFEKLVELLA